MKKTPRQSEAVMTEMVLPNDTNPLNNMMGGKLMYLMDIVGAIAAQRHSHQIVVTASADNISFKNPIGLGDIVTLNAKVTRAFQSSMEVYINVTAENLALGKQTVTTNHAFFTYVALDKTGKPIAVPELVPETDQEKEMYDSALKRRQVRLILAGRLQPNEAEELKALFFPDK
jgi:acyl-CoA hydrolase